MTSINFSSSATSALRSLQATSKAMDQAQTRIATGHKVNDASDNASLWNVAQTVRGEISGTDDVQTGLKTALARAKSASSGLDTVQTILSTLKSKLAQAHTSAASSTARISLQSEISALQSQLETVVASAKFGGVNWLNKSVTNISVYTGSYTSTLGATTSTTDGITGVAGILDSAGATGILDTVGAALSDATTPSIMTMTVTTLSDADITTMESRLNTAIIAVDDAATTMSAFAGRLETQSSFLTSLNDIKSKALGSLIDADLNEESAKLSALQVSQQLATTALQIANQSRANILQLFQ